MVWSLRQLSDVQTEVQPGVWETAKPLGVTLRDRIRGALAVLRGEAAAVRWY